MSELALYIQSYFGVIQDTELNQILSLFEKKIIKKNEFLLHAGKPCKELSFVQSGLMRMFLNLEDREVTQWISTKGYFAVDLSGFIFETPSRLSIQALVDSEVYSISKENYNKIGKWVPAWHELEKLFLVRCFVVLEERIMSHLSMTAEERYALFFDSNKELFNQVPLQYIASMLGMTPETFSRIRKKHQLK